MNRVTFYMISLLLLNSCSNSNSNNLPEHIQKLDNLTIHTPAKKIHTIRFQYEQTFGDTDELLTEKIFSIAVDKIGRVYIADGPQLTIHIYQPDGKYVTNMGQEGSGPGEFRAIGMMKIKANQLFVYDSFLQRINIFCLDSLSLNSSLNLPSKGWPSRFFIRRDGNILVGYFSSMAPNKDRYTHYYLLNKKGEIISENIFELKARTIFGDETDGVSVTMNLPFKPKPLIDLTDGDLIFSARSDHFLVKVHNSDGKYIRAFYYPYQHASFDQNSYIDSFGSQFRNHKRAVQNLEFPKTWPALEQMLIDDQNRVWISTIVEDFSVYQWWVMDASDGHLLARFRWPKDKKIETIKNGKLYTRETDEETGLEEVVRYDIVME